MTDKNSQRLIEKLKVLEKYQFMENFLAKADEEMEEAERQCLDEDQITAIKAKINNK